MTASTMSAAIEIARYFEEHAKAAFRMMGAFEKQEIKDARYIWKRILSTGEGELTKGDVINLCKGRLSAEVMQPGLNILESHGYIHTESIRTGGVGRPKVVIQVNPKARKQKDP